MQKVSKPHKRSKLRRRLGKEYFILKRKFLWLFGTKKWANNRKNTPLEFEIKKHQSFLLRPLKDVDMQLQYNKVTNLRLALNNITGIVIKPGETFSFWKMVGRTTKSKGYLDGMVLQDGKVLKGTGGGLCQMGNLIYWMALHTPLQVTERWRHSYDVFPDINRKVPFGAGATLSYNYVDLQLYNPTKQDYQINLWLNETHLNGSINSTEELGEEYTVIETDHQIQHQWWGGYTRHNKIWKVITNKATAEEHTEPVTENHAIMMYEPLLEN